MTAQAEVSIRLATPFTNRMKVISRRLPLPENVCCYEVAPVSMNDSIVHTQDKTHCWLELMIRTF